MFKFGTIDYVRHATLQAKIGGRQEKGSSAEQDMSETG